MITNIEIQNCWSFIDVKVDLKPFTLVIGPNGAGKSNFLKVLSKLGPKQLPGRSATVLLERHFALGNDHPQKVMATVENDGVIEVFEGDAKGGLFQPREIRLFGLDPEKVGLSESIFPMPEVGPSGENAVVVLDSLKNGDRDDLFNEVEAALCKYVPTIEKLSSQVTKEGQKRLQVREKHIENPLPVSELSEGTKLLLLILTIVYQENPPRVILLEDIDRGLHARLFEQVVQMLRSVVRDRGVQIIATTHNPYLIDEFVDHEDAVLIIEKENGGSTITTLAKRLETGEIEQDALGSLWFGGFVGGVPKL